MRTSGALKDATDFSVYVSVSNLIARSDLPGGINDSVTSPFATFLGAEEMDSYVGAARKWLNRTNRANN